MYNEPKDVRGLRVAAAFIDYFIFGMLIGVVTIVQLIVTFATGNDNPFTNRLYTLIIYLIQVIISFSYYTLVPYLTKGKSLGKLFVGIKTLNYNYERASIWRFLFRNVYFFYYFFINGVLMLISAEFAMVASMFLSSYLLILVHFVNLLFVLITKDARGFHDYIAGTIVVHKTFDLNKINETNELERRQMDWAEFDDDVKVNEKEDKITILETEKDEITILKKDEQ